MSNQNGVSNRQSQRLQHLPFSEAADLWLEQRKMYIRESTADCYRDYLSRLKGFFACPLSEIHVGHLMQYQGQMRKLYHPSSVNHDLNILSQMLHQAGLWMPIREYYRPLPLPEADPPRVMSELEESRFFEFASKNPKWQLAYYVASLTNNSTASGKELRMLQLSAIHLDNDPPYFHVPKNMKTPQRQRNIPLNERGVTMVQRLLELAKKRGSTRPEHYLFPFREKRNFFNPNRPASESWLKYRWKLLVDAAMHTCINCSVDQAECQCPKFRPILSFALKPHNMRHQVITNMIDSGVPIETVRMIAGHGVDSLVTRHYHHARMETMARAMDMIDPDKKRLAPPCLIGNSHI
jgi:integrase